MQKQRIVAIAAAGLVMAAVNAQAHEQGDFILRAGFAMAVPSDSSDPILLPGLPEDTLPGGVEVDSGAAISLIGDWMINDRWGLELLAATPFEHDIDVKDLGIAAGSAKHLPPTLSMQWYPRGGMQGWQPYFGLGVNYTTFFDEEVDPALGTVLGDTLGVTSAELSLDDSLGWAAQAGVDVPINDDWFSNAGVWYIDIGTTADIKVGFADGARDTVSFDVDIDPWVYNLGFSYRF